MSVERYLALDTSTIAGVVAAFEVEGPKRRMVATFSLSLETSKHSERLLWTIDTVLEGAGWKLSELKGIVCGVGPGSFTGIRIGITTAAMLATQLKIPVIPISSLVLLARQAVDSLFLGTSLIQRKKLEKTLVLACTDATKGEWFTLMGSARSILDSVMMAEGDAPGIWARGLSEAALTPETVFLKANQYLKKAGSTTPWIAVGQSVERYAEEFNSLPSKNRIEIHSSIFHQVDPRTLMQLGWEAIQQGILRDPSLLRPRYLRDSDAEVKLRNGQLKPAPLFNRGGIA